VNLSAANPVSVTGSARNAKKKGTTMNNKRQQTNLQRPMSRRQQMWEDDWLDEEPVSTVPALRFSPTAWAKLLYFRDKSQNEVGGFGITKPDDLLFVTEFITVKQEVSCVSVKFDDEAVSKFFDEQVDLGRKPEQFARVWLHTHPGESPEPSSTDEQTFKRVFGACQWAVMFVLAQDGSTYARLSLNIGPGGQILIPVDVDYSQDFGPSDHKCWDVEYEFDLRAVEWLGTIPLKEQKPAPVQPAGCALPYDLLSEFERMEPVQRQLILDELADRPELWSGEEVCVL
jgi:proteasome lid subunit RPN8/RPN11